MKGYYFANYEQIAHKGERNMIIMDIKIDNMYSFKNFHMNMSYPKKIVDSTIQTEYLKDRTNFRYKKVNIIMGGNATGKTSLGRILMYFMNYFRDGEYQRLVNLINNTNEPALLEVDFVTYENILYNFKFNACAKNDEKYRDEDINISIIATDIGKTDNYEMCKKRLLEDECRIVDFNEVDTNGWSFSYPRDVESNKRYKYIEDDSRYVCILEKILKTLDPAIQNVSKSQEVENTYLIKLGDRTVIIQDGRIHDVDVLSSGTKAGIDISYIIASIVCDMHDLYYCDELFSYVNSDIEKACLSIIIEKLDDRKQLFFTTHNTDVLDMQLPKHAFTFLKKDVNDKDEPIKCVNAAQYLKRNTDSLKHAVENDLFCVAPEVERLYEILKL